MDNLMTTRLLLHPLSAAEAASVEAGEPPAGTLWAPGYPGDGDRGVARRFLETCADAGSPQPFGAYEIRRRADGHVIGGVGFHGRPDSDGRVTIGYGLIPSVRGLGYASEALRALLAFARSQGVVSVKGDADLDNTRSHHVMAAAGMRLVGEDDRLKHFRIDWTGTGRTPDA
ncbi:GNAT family N-acetyltransferase [Streptomyces sp. NBC_00887]|uniref:GNAT family N-acetyltransferase n=1 Tax=Streptomyces sp. NBC_00887 TaxID=2975859 RepID=UPI00386FCF5B|nr:GNAT family N-acetyltransferase [Streptomyces sp. NBC_00887]